MKNNKNNISTIKLSPGNYLETALSIDVRNIRVDMAMQLLSHGYGYDTVMIVTGWSQLESDTFQDDIAWDKQQGVSFDWLPNNTCKEMRFDPDDWLEEWFRIVSTKFPEIRQFRDDFQRKQVHTISS